MENLSMDILLKKNGVKKAFFNKNNDFLVLFLTLENILFIYYYNEY